MSSVKAIQTEYNGFKFRSRTEARWAIFFDALGVKWEYELEGYDVGDGLYYLPDFVLHDVKVKHIQEHTFPNLFVEIKGVLNDTDAKKINRFSDAWNYYYQDGQAERPIIVFGEIPQENYISRIFDAHNESCNKPVTLYDLGDIDCDINYTAVPTAVGNGKGMVLFGEDYCEHDDETECAFKIARQARFEHGETPTADDVQRMLRDEMRRRIRV